MFELQQIDPVLAAEAVIVILIIISQIVIFNRNNLTIRRLKRIYPDPAALGLATPEEGAAQSVAQIDEAPPYHPTFREILQATNAYLRKNKGAADFDILSDMAQAKDRSIEHSIDSSLSLPLYIGLLSTFIGVIIGLVKIALTGVTDDAIQSFIGGVLIGMAGSFMGLALTVRSNSLFKDAKKIRDQGQYEYLTFLRAHILPALQAPQAANAQSPETPLRETLQAFQSGFAEYQATMQESLRGTIKLFHEVKDVFERIRNIESGLESVNTLMRQNDKIIDKQVGYIDTYIQRAETLSRVLSEHTAGMEKRFHRLVDDQIKSLDSSAQAAYMKMDQYLASLSTAGSKEFVDGIQRDFVSLRDEMDQVQKKNLDVSIRLLERIEQDEKINLRISQQMEAMNANLKQVLLGQDEARKDFTNSLAFKVFAYTGSLLFIAALAAGVVYLWMNVVR